VITLLNIRGVDAGKWLNNVAALGGIVPLTVLILLAAVSYLRFGSATQFLAATLIPHLTLRNAVFWSSVFFAFGGLKPAARWATRLRTRGA